MYNTLDYIYTIIHTCTDRVHSKLSEYSLSIKVNRHYSLLHITILLFVTFLITVCAVLVIRWLENIYNFIIMYIISNRGFQLTLIALLLSDKHNYEIQ